MSACGAGFEALSELWPQPTSSVAADRQRPSAETTRITLFKVAARRSAATRPTRANDSALRAHARFCHTRARSAELLRNQWRSVLRQFTRLLTARAQSPKRSYTLHPKKWC